MHNINDAAAGVIRALVHVIAIYVLLVLLVVNIKTETCLRPPLSQQHVELPDLSHACLAVSVVSQIWQDMCWA